MIWIKKASEFLKHNQFQTAAGRIHVRPKYCLYPFSDSPATPITQAATSSSNAPVKVGGGGPIVMEIDGCKYVYIMKPTGESELVPIPVPKTTKELQVVETHVEVHPPPAPTPSPAKPIPNPAIVPSASITASVTPPTMSAPVSINNSAIYATPVTSVTVVESPPIVEAVANASVSETNEGQHAETEMGGTESSDTVSLMIGNTSFLCIMITDVMGFFYQQGKKEIVMFPTKPSTTHCNFLPKMQLVNMKLNMPCSLMQKSVSLWIQGLLPAKSSKK